ncbi:MAG: hypothetical protein KGJ77_10390 [Acidobacteriota bacterium]|nr:hypothetical protein [Acidobacteriota bacterium]
MTSLAAATPRARRRGLAASSSDQGEPAHGVVPRHPPGPWGTVADSADPALGGEGVRLAGRFSAGAEVRLAAFGFCALVCDRGAA